MDAQGHLVAACNRLLGTGCYISEDRRQIVLCHEAWERGMEVLALRKEIHDRFKGVRESLIPAVSRSEAFMEFCAAVSKIGVSAESKVDALGHSVAAGNYIQAAVILFSRTCLYPFLSEERKQTVLYQEAWEKGLEVLALRQVIHDRFDGVRKSLRPALSRSEAFREFCKALLKIGVSEERIDMLNWAFQADEEEENI